ELRTADLEVARQKERILTEYFQQNPQFVRKADEQKGDKDWWIEEFAVLDFDQSLKDSLADAFEAKAHQQADFAQSLLGLSPALAVHYQLVTLAGTGREATGGYQQNIKKQQQEWSASMRTKYLADQKLTNTDYEAFAALPTRVWAEADMGNAASGGWWLLMQCFLVGGLVWLVSRRPW
ncbi:MAG: DUF3526 domain-containing protein, partial [Saprospiraceae bacterium]|nr:DUF3526 domain-containing protein [Saprospiraceae bacterium]